MPLQYAQNFAVDYYKDGYTLLSITDGRRYLIIPEGKAPPEDLETAIITLQQPLTHIYLVATAVMDMFRKLESLDAIRFSSQQAENWYIEEARQEMEKGNILYAGKYNMPDYEKIVSEGCSLAVENNMISHSPEVAEKLENFGIPVWIDLSSYEPHPLGRVEWIKLYGVLLGKESLAEQVFQEQAEAMERAAAEKPSGKTVAFFYLDTNGAVHVRSSTDYVPKMIALAGGKYIFEDLGSEGTARSTVTMQMEEFYHTAKDADYLIYNSTIEGEVANVEDLLQREKLLGDFRAVQEGHVWCATKDLYQNVMSIGQMVEDIHKMLSEGSGAQEELAFLYHLE